MLEFLKTLNDADYDTYLFLPGEEENKIHVQGSMYKDPGTKLGGSMLGDCYHIILFKEDDEGAVIKLDLFEAILSAPLEYISMLMPDDWYGIICKKTTTSQPYVQKTFDNIKEMC